MRMIVKGCNNLPQELKPFNSSATVFQYVTASATKRDGGNNVERWYDQTCKGSSLPADYYKDLAAGPWPAGISAVYNPTAVNGRPGVILTSITSGTFLGPIFSTNSVGTELANLPSTFSLMLVYSGVSSSITLPSLPITDPLNSAAAFGQKWLMGPIHGGTKAGIGISVGTNGILVGGHGDSYIAALAAWSGTPLTANVLCVTVESNIPRIYCNDSVSPKATGVNSPRVVKCSGHIGYPYYGGAVGTLGELIIFSGIISSQERTQFMKYLGSKYGITVT